MIESYDFGIIVFNGKRYIDDVLIFPDRLKGNWWWKVTSLRYLSERKQQVENPNSKCKQETRLKLDLTSKVRLVRFDDKISRFLYVQL